MVDKFVCTIFALFGMTLMVVTAALLLATLRDGHAALAVVNAVCLVVQAVFVGWQVFLLSRG